ncbi:MAG: Uma2 family endonuclease [Emticicia sp.]|uniref:Uma2 family endonuclease n=1 Tax=Emticicia sp. TaxID=1930953 RepID=UPI003BA7C7A5
MFQEDLLDKIMDLPDAPALVKQVAEKLNDENQRRQKFYNDIDEQIKVEFINGEIITHSPVRREHNEATGLLYQLINVYVRKNKLGFVGFEKIMTTFTRNDYEPDIVFFNTEKSKSFTKKQVLFPVPDFIVEVLSDGTKDKDRGVKFTDYENHKVGEYWIIDAEKEVVEQYLISNGQYELVLKSSNGSIKSSVIEGFEIPIKAIFDEEHNLEAMQNLLK